LVELSDIVEQHKRVAKLVESLTGNFVEIGAGTGTLTRIMLERVKETGHMVYVVDPFEKIEGADPTYFEPYKYTDFLNTIGDLAEFMHLIKKPSQDKSVAEELGNINNVAMVFVDGLQTKNEVLSDLYLAESLKPRVIVVDDVDRLTGSSQVPLALKEFKTKYKYTNIGKREGYLCNGVVVA